MSLSHNKAIFDKVQFEELFRLHFEALCRFATHYVADSQTAQDICQMVFIRLWEKRAEIDPALSIKSYLFTATKNRCLNYIRDNSKFRSNVLDLECGDINIAREDDHLEEQELKTLIEKALNKLPDKCRLVFEMSRYQGLKYKDIARRLDIAQKTVEAHMSKAMRMLREELKDYLLWIILFYDYLNL